MSHFSNSFVSNKNEPPHLIYHVNIYREMYAKMDPYFYGFVTDSYETS